MRERIRSYTNALPCIGLTFLANMRRDLADVPDGYAIYTSTESGMLWIIRTGSGYTSTINGHSLTLSLTTTKAGYGVRHWYLCPHCHQRCAKLYIGRKDIACRKCWGLHYASQSEARLARMRQIIRSKRVAIWGSDTPQVMNLFWSSLWFDKPKSMRWKTFESKRRQLAKLEAGYSMASAPVFERLVERAERMDHNKQ